MPSRPSLRRTARTLAAVPGLLVAGVIAVVATALGTLMPVVGAPVFGVLLGVVAGVALGRGPARAVLGPGVRVASRVLLQVAVVLLGARLSLAQVLEVGASGLPLLLGTLAISLAAAWLLTRALGVDRDLGTLIGVGTAICGASAIAAVTPVLRAHGRKVAYALSTVFAFNVAAVLAFPPLGHALGMSEHAFGLFAGTAVNDMSSVVAAATTYGPEAAHTAVVVKLARTLAIIPICLALAAIVARRTRRGLPDGGPAPRVHPLHLVPWFLVGFLVVVAANTAGLLPAAAQEGATAVAAFLITTALAAIGLSTDVPGLRRTGARPLVLGGLVWVVLTVASLGLLAMRGS